MLMTSPLPAADALVAPLAGTSADAAPAQRYRAVRAYSAALVEGLSDADATVQSMDDASPAKWHLAHTAWFFEEFVLAGARPAYRSVDARYRYLFNSYYESVGPRHPRPRRGLLTRPSLADVLRYRAAVDAAMEKLLAGPLPGATLRLIELGLQHEMQHQELLLTDLLHLFAQNPLRPAYREAPDPPPAAPAPPLAWIGHAGGRCRIGADTGADAKDGAGASGFAFDCEGPRHEVLLRPFRLAARPVSNAEWSEFIADGGYRRPTLWLADGWKAVQAESWTAPLYWEDEAGEAYREDAGAPRAMTLFGVQALDPAAPVAHLSYFEADAYARWAGKRLPSEFEWEIAARDLPVRGNFADSGALRPLAAPQPSGGVPGQMYGDVWEWTASPFVAYPGFRPAGGAVGEYNGKFMCNQFVLRGGSCATPAGHLRPSYRNFFYPQQRWQFAGLRLAEDAS